MRGAIAETQTSLARGLMRFHLHTSRFIRSKRVAVAASMPQPFMSRADNCPAALYTHDWDLAALGAGERASRGILRPHGERAKTGSAPWTVRPSVGRSVQTSLQPAVLWGLDDPRFGWRLLA